MQIGSLESLRLIFRQAVGAVLAAGSTLAGGCNGEAPGLEVEPGFVPMSCNNGNQRWLANLKFEPSVDYMELVSSALGVRTVLDRFGTPCSSAIDQSACQSALAMLPLDRGFGLGQLIQGPNAAQLNVTRGDAVVALTTRQSVIDFLRPIDTHGEAVLVVELSNFDVSCDRGGSLETETGFKVQAFQRLGCDGRARFVVQVTRDGEVSQLSALTEKEPNPNCIVGRRPTGLCRPIRRSNRRSLGGYFAHAASLEAASVDAFEILEIELQAHRAPSELQRAARRAARDEVRHARLVAGLARRFGITAEQPGVQVVAIRGLEDIALENVSEGCVRETFGALVGRWQAVHAVDPEVRGVYRRVAQDELRHAALAWRVAGWVEPRLTEQARRRLVEARHEAIRTLKEELAVEPSSEVRRLAGVPGARHAGALFEHLVASLWSAKEIRSRKAASGGR